MIITFAYGAETSGLAHLPFCIILLDLYFEDLQRFYVL